MNKEMLDKLEKSMYAVNIVWSTLEAVVVAMDAEYAVCETYRDAVQGAADKAYFAKENLQQILAECNK